MYRYPYIYIRNTHTPIEIIILVVLKTSFILQWPVNINMLLIMTIAGRFSVSENPDCHPLRGNTFGWPGTTLEPSSQRHAMNWTLLKHCLHSSEF